jgi:MFS family permease
MAVLPRFTAWAELDRRIWTLAWARAVNTVGLSLVMAFLGVYVVDERGYSAALYGAIAMGANLAQSMTNAWAGELSDRIGRRPIMVGSLVVRAFAIALLGVQILLHAPLWSLALNFVASSALRGCFEPAAYALVADIARPDQRVPAFGLQRMGINLGWAVGPAAGGLLAVVIPYGAVFFFAAVGLLAAAWTCHGLVDPREKGAGKHLEPVRLRDAFAEAMAQPPMVALLVGSFLFSLAHTQMFSVFAIYMTKGLGLAKDEVGLLYTINGALVLLMQWPALGAIRRIGTSVALVSASLVFACGFGLIGAADGFAGGALAIAVITVAEVLFAPAHQAAAAESGDAARLGKSFGLVGFVQMLGVAFGPLVGGALFDAIGHHHMWMWGAVSGVCLALAITFVIYARLASTMQSLRAGAKHGRLPT